MSKRVLVAMSGGVDSSVAALLLQQQGYEAIGCTLNLWSYENRVEPYNECCSLEVRTVCQQLGIPHHLLDCGQDFKRAVVDPFIESYLQGQTPNPCGHCNRLVRFPLLLEAMERLDCELLATGHHAQIERVDGHERLIKGVDPFKDQSYFLYGLQPERLSSIRFPVGGMLKSEVWRVASEHHLVSARKPESQDLCFLPRGDYRAFLKNNTDVPIVPGEIVDTTGRVVGQHEGLPFYTVGQRRGLSVSRGGRSYVVGFEPEQNRLVIGDEAHLYAEGLVAGALRWLGPPPDESLSVTVKIRYRGPALPAHFFALAGAESQVEVRFDRPQRSIAPGQLVVFYHDNVVLGGGVIQRALKATKPAATVTVV